MNVEKNKSTYETALNKACATTWEARPAGKGATKRIHLKHAAGIEPGVQDGGGELPQLSIELRDGTRALLRPVLPEDRGRLQHGLLRMSAESRYRRFFSYTPGLSGEQLRYFTEIDQENHVAWIALDPLTARHSGIGIARFIRMKDQPNMAEIAIAAVDAFQDQGLGTALLAILYLMAQKRGITTLRAVVLIENSAMTSWFRRLGAKGGLQTAGVAEMDLIIHSDLSRLPENPTAKRFAHLVRTFRNQIQMATDE